MYQRSLVLLLVVCLGFSGCASKYGEQTAIVVEYSDCYEPIRTLRAEENRVAKTTAAIAVAGGILGGVLGGLRGGIKGAILGAAGGAAAAGTLGYFVAVQQKSKDENARMAHYLQDLNGDISGLDIATASARRAIQCYEEKFEMRLAQYKEKAISREQLEESYKEIKSGVDEAQRILGKVIVTAQESDGRYQAAINEEEKRPLSNTQANLTNRPKRTGGKQPQNGGEKQSPPEPPKGSLDEVKTTRLSYQTSIADAQKSQKEAEDFSARMAENMS